MRTSVLRSLYLMAGLSVILFSGHRPAQAVPVVPPANAIKTDTQIQKVHGWHCGRRYGWYTYWRRGKRYRRKGWHRHRRACTNYLYSPYYYDNYIYVYPRYRRKWRRRPPRFRRRPPRVHPGPPPGYYRPYRPPRVRGAPRFRDPGAPRFRGGSPRMGGGGDFSRGRVGGGSRGFGGGGRMGGGRMGGGGNRR